MVRALNEEVPENAEVCISIRWREEVEVDPKQLAAMQARAQAPQGTGVPPGQPIMRGVGPVCITCGGYPEGAGPTPDCEDESGCGRIREHYGDMPVPTVAAPGGAGAHVGLGGGGGGGARKVVVPDKETGAAKTVFAGKDGAPYGHHDDYSKK
jgi:hypothetical protein